MRVSPHNHGGRNLTVCGLHRRNRPISQHPLHNVQICQHPALCIKPSLNGINHDSLQMFPTTWLRRYSSCRVFDIFFHILVVACIKAEASRSRTLPFAPLFVGPSTVSPKPQTSMSPGVHDAEPLGYVHVPRLRHCGRGAAGQGQGDRGWGSGGRCHAGAALSAFQGRALFSPELFSEFFSSFSFIALMVCARRPPRPPCRASRVLGVRPCRVWRGPYLCVRPALVFSPPPLGAELSLPGRAGGAEVKVFVVRGKDKKNFCSKTEENMNEK